MTTIGVDIDGVLADLNTPMCAMYEKITGKKLIPNGWYPVHEDGTPYSRDALDAVFNTPRLWETLGIYPGSWAAIKLLKTIGDVYLHTCPPPKSRNFYAERKNWAEALFPGIPLVITEDKALLKADYFIDDRFYHMKAFLNANVDSAGLLVYRSWSKDKHDEPDYYPHMCCVCDVYEAAELIRVLAGGWRGPR